MTQYFYHNYVNKLALFFQIVKGCLVIFHHCAVYTANRVKELANYNEKQHAFNQIPEIEESHLY